MKEQINNAIDWIKEQPIKGCITGSCLLEYFEGQDIDVFTYDEKSFNKILFAMHHNDMFTILDPLEKWKFEQYINKNNSTFYKFGLITIKFNYNTGRSKNEELIYINLNFAEIFRATLLQVFFYSLP